MCHFIQCVTSLFTGKSRDVVVNALDCDIVVGEFELHSWYYVHFRFITPWELNLLILLAIH